MPSHRCFVFPSIAAASICLLQSLAARAEWVPQHSELPSASFRSVQALSEKVIWIGGSGGACLRSIDGGRTWQNRSVQGANMLDFRALVALNSRTALAVSAGPAQSGNARIYRTSDGGTHWQIVFETSEPGAFLDGMAFWDRNSGLVLGDPIDGKWFLLRTADGGRNWSRIPPQSLPQMLPNEGAFAASNSSLVVSESGEAFIASGSAEHARVFLSGDRGSTWTVVNTPMPVGPTAGIYGLRFWDRRNGVGVGGDYKQEHANSNNVIVTEDGGRTWLQSGPTDPAGLKESVVALPGSVLLAVGPSGTSISRNHGRSWKQVDSVPLHAASCVEAHCWAVGAKGLIVRWRP
jgi:photosystem II stability/assembly factor-like uncharacterized protein